MLERQGFFKRLCRIHRAVHYRALRCKSCKCRTNGSGSCGPVSGSTSLRLDSAAGNWCEDEGKLQWIGRWSGGPPPRQRGKINVQFHTDYWIRSFGGAPGNTGESSGVCVCVSLFTPPRQRAIMVLRQQVAINDKRQHPPANQLQAQIYKASI